MVTVSDKGYNLRGRSRTHDRNDIRSIPFLSGIDDGEIGLTERLHERWEEVSNERYRFQPLSTEATPY